MHNHLRHLLQVGYTDHLVGELLERLKRTGLLERALIVVTADHGYSFRVGVDSRRFLSEDNVEEIAPVPLFVKAPGQMDGRKDDSLVANLDMVATVADLLGTTVGYPQDGRSAFSEEVERRTGIALSTRDFAGTVRIGLPELQRRRPCGGAAGRGCSGRARRATCCTETRGRAPTGSARTGSCSTAG